MTAPTVVVVVTFLYKAAAAATASLRSQHSWSSLAQRCDTRTTSQTSQSPPRRLAVPTRAALAQVMIVVAVAKGLEELKSTPCSRLRRTKRSGWREFLFDFFFAVGFYCSLTALPAVLRSCVLGVLCVCSVAALRYGCIWNTTRAWMFCYNRFYYYYYFFYYFYYFVPSHASTYLDYYSNTLKVNFDLDLCAFTFVLWLYVFYFYLFTFINYQINYFYLKFLFRKNILKFILKLWN